MLTLIVPQLFPGLIYRMIKPKVVLLIFVSGKIVLTGAKVNIPFLTRVLHSALRARRLVDSLRYTFADAVVFVDRLGQRGDLYSVQHYLHGALRIPQALNYSLTRATVSAPIAFLSAF